MLQVCEILEIIVKDQEQQIFRWKLKILKVCKKYKFKLLELINQICSEYYRFKKSEMFI